MNEFARRLADGRPRLNPSELEAARKEIRSRRPSARPRLVLIAVLVCGILLSTAGAGLAISGAAGQGNAAQVQYTSPSGNSGGPCPRDMSAARAASVTCPGSQPGDVLGVGQSGGKNGVGNAPGGGANNVRGTEPSGTQGTTSGSQVTRQVAASAGGNLPFTGYAGIVVLVLGLALLGAGLVLRRTTAGHQS